MLRTCAFAALLPVVLLAACAGHHDDLEAARRELADVLPPVHEDGMSLESIEVDGHRIILLVRSDAADADTARAHPRFDALVHQEQEDMLDLCALPTVQALTDPRTRVVRRFVDLSGAPYFEAELAPRQCLGGRD